MVKLTPGRILVADNRPVTQTDAIQRFEYLSGDVQTEKLAVCEDSFLAAQQNVSVEAPADGYMVIIPVTGALDIICGGELPLRIDVGEVHMRYKKKGAHCTLVNQYAADWINFIYVHLEASAENAKRETVTFDFDQNPNRLIDLFGKGLPFKLSIGMFGGREEAFYQPQAGKGLFALVIAGAFEMQGRLLHQRDGLALWDVKEADIEALSNSAVMVLLEF